MMLVVNPPGSLLSDLAAKEPPLWAGLIAAGYGADILDVDALGLDIDGTVRAIRASGHDRVLLVVMGSNPSVASAPKMPVAEEIAGRLWGLDVEMAGLHPNAIGYKRYPVVRAPFKGTPDIPYELLPPDRYRAHNWHCLGGKPRTPYGVTYTSLGCPYKCRYCNIHALYGGSHKVVFRPVEAVLREIHLLAGRYQVRNLKFWDELFTLKEDRVLAICEGMKGLDLNAWCYGRLDSVTPRMLRAMKDGGINWIAYGFENVKDPKLSPGVRRVIDMTREAGIAIIANFMMGYQGGEADRATMDFAKYHLFEWANFYTALPYPGSPWWEEEGRPMEIEWDQYRRTDRRTWFNEYFSNPAYQEHIGRRFGTSVIDEVRQMLKTEI